MPNNKLEELYKRFENDIFQIDLQPDESIHGPFLIASSDGYNRSKVKIAVIGQETKGWSCTYSIEDQINTYRNFDYGRNYYSSPFWNVIRKTEKAFGCSEYSSAWLNLNRYDENARRPSAGNLKRLASLDFLLLEEVKILCPDIILFFTGPFYDRRIEVLFDGKLEQVKGFTGRQLSKLVSKKLDVPMFRTCHPNYLRRSGLEKCYLAFIQNVADHIFR